MQRRVGVVHLLATRMEALEPDDGAGDPVPGHPQYGLRLLLDRLGVERGELRADALDHDLVGAHETVDLQRQHLAAAAHQHDR